MLIFQIIAYFISKFFNDLLKYIVIIPLIHHKNCGYVYLSPPSEGEQYTARLIYIKRQLAFMAYRRTDGVNARF